MIPPCRSSFRKERAIVLFSGVTPKMNLLFCLLLSLSQAFYGQQKESFVFKHPEALALQDNKNTAQADQLYQQAKAILSAQPDSAMQLVRQALNRSIQTGYNYGIAKNLLAIGFIYSKKGLSEKAITTTQMAYAYFKGPRRTELLLDFYDKISGYYAELGYNDTAIQYCHKALQILGQQPVEDSAGVRAYNIYQRLGSIYISDMNQLSLSIAYFEKARSIAVKQQQYEWLGRAYLGIGGAYINGSVNQIWDTAGRRKGLAYLRSALKSGLERKDSSIISNAYTSISTFYLNTNIWDSAEVYIDKALSFATKDVRGISENSIQSYIVLGVLAYRKKNFTKAEYYFQEARTGSLAFNSRIRLLNIDQNLSQVYIQKQEYKKALAHLQAYSTLRDTLLNEEKVNATAQLEVKYRSTEQEKELAVKNFKLLQQASLLKEKNTWISLGGAGILLLMAFLFILWLNNQNRRQRQEKKVLHMEQEQKLWKQGEEIRHLNAIVKGEEQERARLGRELHDGIGGQLAAVKMNFKTLQNKYENPETLADFSLALQHLHDTARDLRKTAHNLMPEILIQQGLIVATESFCEKTASFTGIRISFVHKGYLPRLDIDFELSIYRMIQELVQNIIKHARAANALVQIDYHDPLLVLTIEDDGVGMTQSDYFPAGGLGISNLQIRIKALQGHMDINSRILDGTSVYLEFDLSIIKSLLSG